MPNWYDYRDDPDGFRCLGNLFTGRADRSNNNVRLSLVALKGRLVIALALMILVFPIYKFMPAHWTERMWSIGAASEDTSFQERLGAWQTSFNIAKARPFTGGGFNSIESPSVYKIYGDNPAGRPRAAHSIYFEVLGDHGFIGLIIYVSLLMVSWRYAGATARKARQDPELEWVADLAAMVQVSLVTFAVAGAALSVAYYDIFYLLVGVIIVLREIVSRRQTRAEIGASYPALALLSQPG